MQNGSSTIVKGDDVQLCDVLASLILKGETVEEWQNSEVRRQLESNTPVARRVRKRIKVSSGEHNGCTLLLAANNYQYIGLGVNESGSNLTRDILEAIRRYFFRAAVLTDEEVVTWNAIKEFGGISSGVPAVVLHEDRKLAFNDYGERLVKEAASNSNLQLIDTIELMMWLSATQCPIDWLPRPLSGALARCYQSLPDPSAVYFRINDKDKKVEPTDKFGVGNLFCKLVECAYRGGIDRAQLRYDIERFVLPSLRSGATLFELSDGQKQMFDRLRRGGDRGNVWQCLTDLNIVVGDGYVSVRPRPNHNCLDDMLLSNNYNKVAEYFSNHPQVKMNGYQVRVLRDMIMDSGQTEHWEIRAASENDEWLVLCRDPKYGKNSFIGSCSPRYNEDLYQLVATPLLEMLQSEECAELSFNELEIMVGRLLFTVLPRLFDDSFAPDQLIELQDNRQELLDKLDELQTERLRSSSVQSRFNAAAHVVLTRILSSEDAVYQQLCSVSYQKEMLDSLMRSLYVAFGSSLNQEESDSDEQSEYLESGLRDVLERGNNFVWIMARLMNDLSQNKMVQAQRLADEWLMQKCNSEDRHCIQTALDQSAINGGAAKLVLGKPLSLFEEKMAQNKRTEQELAKLQKVDLKDEELFDLNQEVLADRLNQLDELRSWLEQLDSYLTEDVDHMFKDSASRALLVAVHEVQRVTDQMATLANDTQQTSRNRFLLCAHCKARGGIASSDNYIGSGVRAALVNTVERMRPLLMRGRIGLFERFCDWVIKLFNPGAARFRVRKELEQRSNLLRDMIQ